ncbi:hypothetical protein [Bradyrhizobium acaciae]|uniref:hypothetical protein n=1 Tax=Bradyrhizobium acaciae TaxID=2683706 RepID=UPI001E48FD27|nr:hypothetical protein [Bradyrhizobium acaciae]MCC8979687.1 hypothetical protein [Bradyrhizobium acaciae]
MSVLAVHLMASLIFSPCTDRVAFVSLPQRARWISGTTSFRPIDFANHRTMPDTTVIPNSATTSNEPISAAPEQSRSTNLILPRRIENNAAQVT